MWQTVERNSFRSPTVDGAFEAESGRDAWNLCCGTVSRPVPRERPLVSTKSPPRHTAFRYEETCGQRGWSRRETGPQHGPLLQKAIPATETE